MKWRVIHWLETTKHKLWVAWYICKVCTALIRRAIVHDLSKYSSHEAPYFERALPRLRNLEYGTEEYREAISSLGPALSHHYNNNTHHPEYWAMRDKPGVYLMSDLDRLEMLCDWAAAVRRHKTGDLGKSISINAERFGYDHDRELGFLRDAREIGLLK